MKERDITVLYFKKAHNTVSKPKLPPANKTNK